MPYSVVLYYRSGQYEPGMRFYVPLNVANMQGLVDTVADAVAELQSPTVLFSRWELINELGAKEGEGVLDEIGASGGELLPFKYCAYLRMPAAQEVGRVSGKYVHGITEAATLNGNPAPSFLAAIAALSAVVVGLGLLNSNGQAITGVQFGSFTKRNKIRRLP